MTTGSITATFFGVSTILFDDGDSSVLVDGFFSRPSLLKCLLSKIGPDEQAIDAAMKEAGINNNLKAVLVSHSHYDHALDAPAVCERTGAHLVGSESTRMIGAGYGLSDDQIKVVADNDVLKFGAFRITVFEGIHSPGDRFPGEIKQPLLVPTAMSAFRTGKVYSWLIEHKSERIFVHPSANAIPGRLQEIRVSTLFLGVAPIGKQSEAFRKLYWKEVVQALEPKKVIPIHWDNFWVSLTTPLRPLPWWADRWSVVESWLCDNCKAARMELQYLKAWESVDL